MTYSKHAIVLLLAALLCGCSSPSSTKPGTTKPDTSKSAKDGGQHEKAPHGGTLFAPADEKCHVELVIDKAKSTATMYLLDDKADEAVATSAKAFQLTVKGVTQAPIAFPADPQTKDKKDTASRFSVKNDLFAKDIDLEKVEISGDVNGKPYVFNLDK